MSGNVQKIPLQRSLNAVAERRALDAIQLTGKALPCSVVSVSGSIVTVKFEVTSPLTLPKVTVPVLGPEYIRYPIQPGCKGCVIAADAYLGGVTGLGGGVADLSIPANLSALIFVPLANKMWSPTDDPNALVLYGPDGVVIRNLSATCKLVVGDSGATLTLPAGVPLTVNGNMVVTGVITGQNGLQLSGGITGPGGATYSGNLETSGDVIAGKGTGDQVGVQTHRHQYDRPTGASAPAPTASPTAGT